MGARDAVITPILVGGFVVAWSGQHWILALILSLLTVRWVLVCIATDNPEDDGFPGYRDELRTASFLAGYRLLLGRWFLDPLTRLIGDEGELSQHGVNGLLARNFGIQPWTAASFNVLLLLAAVYPVLALVGIWIAGHEGRVGGWVLLSAGEPWQRLLLLLALVAMVFAGLQGCRATGWRKFGWGSVYFGAILGILAVTGAVAIAIAIAAAFTFAFAFVRAAPAGGAGTFAVALAMGVAVAFGVGIGIGLNGTHAFVFSGVFAGVFAVPLVCVVVCLLKRTAGNGPRLAVWLGFAMVMLAVLAGTTLWALPALDDRGRHVVAALLLFLTLLPLLNVAWDWLSLGLSRGLLSGIRLDLQRGWMQLAWALADIVFGFLFLVGLVAMTTAAVAAMNLLYHLGGGAGLLIDLPQYFADLRAAPDHPRFWWLYFMFLSTLIPTVLHLLIAGAAGTQWLAAHWLGFGAWREYMAESMETHGVHRFYAQVYLTIVPMLGLVVPLGLLWLLYLGLTTHSGVVGYALLDGAEGIARFVMGDIFPAQMPEPGPLLLDQTPAAT